MDRPESEQCRDGVVFTGTSCCVSWIGTHNHFLDAVRNFPLTWTMVTIITGITAPFSVIIDGVVLVLATVTDYSGSHYQCCLYYERIGWTAWVRRASGMP